MIIKRNDLDDSIIHLTLTLESSDYAKKFEQKLSTMAAKSNIKGFRIGKTPVSVIKKMYGSSILGELVDEELTSGLNKYIVDNNIRFIAQPLIAENQESITIDVNNMKEYTLTYELGHIPDFTINGISADDIYDYFSPAVNDDYVDTEMNYLARRLGKLEDVDSISGDELVTVTASELENGAIKEGGFSKDVILFLQSLEDKNLKDILLTKKIDDAFNIEVNNLESKDLNFIKKNLFGLAEDYDLKEDDVFHYKIKKISKLIPAELTDELVKEKFDIENLEALKEEMINQYHAKSKPASDNLLRKAIMDNVMAHSEVKISESFVKNWLRRMENLDEDKINEEKDKFITELKWTYIKEELSKQYTINVTEDDIRAIIASRIQNLEMQYGKLPEDTVRNIIKNWYTDKNEVYALNDEARTNKLFHHLFSIIKKEEKVLSSEEFDKLFNTEK